MKRIILVVIVLIVLALAVPVVNLFAGAPESALGTLPYTDDATAAVAGIFAEKCANCHTADYKLPWYAGLPPAKGIIEMDIQMGTRAVDLMTAFQDAIDGPVNEAVLAKIEYTTQNGSMPPMRYLALHWNHALSADEKQAVLDWVAATRATHYQVAGVAEAFAGEAVQPLPRDIAVDPAKVALGNRLYHDVRLSGDDTLSCASCHDLGKGGTDQAPVSTGIRGQLGPINAPTTFNSGFQFAQFWDGRAATLEEQAGGPVENPLEMGAQWPDVIAKLEQDPELMSAFLASYPEMSAANVQHAIAEFERTLVTPDSDFDRYLRGEADAMGEEAQRGYALFKQHGCGTCHVGRILGGQSYERMGYRKDYFASLEREVTDADHGRYAVTKDEMDMHKFKVPTLLNVEVTFPYFHDAATSDLGDAVSIMAEFQAGVTLSAKDNDDLVAFLLALTGKYQGQKLQ